MKSTPIVFLTYMSRSGSTFLSAKLDEYRAIGVSIEGRFPDAWTSGRRVTIDNERDLDSYLNELFAHPEFRTWNVDRERLEADLLCKGFPFRYCDVLYGCLDDYFRDSEVDCYVYKAGEHYLYIDFLRTQFPEAKFVFIDRNPLAIFNSQMRSIDSTTRKPMCTDPVHFMLCYEEIQQILVRHAGRNYLHVVSYERLMTQESREMASLLDFIGLENREKKLASQYYDSIPDHQKYLHENVKSGIFRCERADAWRGELSKSNAAYLRFALGRYLKGKGYEIGPVGVMSLREIARLLVNFVRHAYVKIKGFKPQH